MGFWEHFFENIKNVRFEGRAGVKEYWLFQLATFLFSFIMGFAVGIITAITAAMNLAILAALPWFLLVVVSIYIGFASLALLVRRLHDTNKSGWYYFVTLIPFFGGIILFIFTLLPGDLDINNYGPVERW